MSEESFPPPASARVWAPLVLALWGAALGGVGVGGCAKSPTVIRARISADTTVPPLYLLRSLVARASAPDDVAIVSQVSQAGGDAADRPGAYLFPLTLDLGVPPGWTGDVSVTVQGLSWDVKDQVVATGSASARLSPETQAEAALTLTGVAVVGGGDGGGGDDGDSTDAGDAASGGGDADAGS